MAKKANRQRERAALETQLDERDKRNTAIEVLSTVRQLLATVGHHYPETVHVLAEASASVNSAATMLAVRT